jgi:hypothetical protein
MSVILEESEGSIEYISGTLDFPSDKTAFSIRGKLFEFSIFSCFAAAEKSPALLWLH